MHFLLIIIQLFLILCYLSHNLQKQEYYNYTYTYTNKMEIFMYKKNI